jgi:hypothetical protein
VPKKTRRQVPRVGLAATAGILMVALPCVAQQLTNAELSLTVNAQEGSYQLSLHDGQLVLRSRVAAEVDHEWLRSSDYPRHQASESTFEDDLGRGRDVTVICSGLDGQPDLLYVLQLYNRKVTVDELYSVLLDDYANNEMASLVGASQRWKDGSQGQIETILWRDPCTGCYYRFAESFCGLLP